MDYAGLELASVQLELGEELDEALNLVRAVVARNSGNYAALVLEARIHSVVGRLVDARRVLSAVLAAEPGHAEAIEQLKRLNESQSE
jgi:hypothetical protein